MIWGRGSLGAAHSTRVMLAAILLVITATGPRPLFAEERPPKSVVVEAGETVTAIETSLLTPMETARKLYTCCVVGEELAAKLSADLKACASKNKALVRERSVAQGWRVSAGVALGVAAVAFAGGLVVGVRL